MEIELLKKGIEILDDINMSKIKKSYLKKQLNKHKRKQLTSEDIEELFVIAISEVEFGIEIKKRALDEL